MMEWNQSLDYDKVLKYINKEFKAMYAYVAETEYSRPFANYLRSQGFIVHTKEIRNGKCDNFDVELSLHAYAAPTDQLYICSCSSNLLELFRLLQLRGKFLHFYGVGVPSSYNKYGYVRELHVNLVKDIINNGNDSNAKRLVVPAS